MNAAHQLLRCILIVLWPPSYAFATTVTLDATLENIPVAVWLIVFVLSSMGGLTSLLHRLRLEIPQRMLLYVSSHMLMAWFVGAATFFLLEVSHTPDLLEVPLIGIAAYSGARVIDATVEKFANWVEQRLFKLL